MDIFSNTELKNLLKRYYISSCLNTPDFIEFNNVIFKKSMGNILGINQVLDKSTFFSILFKFVDLITRVTDVECYNCNLNMSECNLASLSKILDYHLFYDSKGFSEVIEHAYKHVSYRVTAEKFMTYLMLLSKVSIKIDNFSKFPSSIFEAILKGIRVRSLLKRVLFRKINNMRKQLMISFKIVLNNIITFRPNYDIPVLSRGSYMYRLNNQKMQKYKFPIHVDPCQLVWLTKKQCLLREKADGIYMDNIPFKHYPQVNLFNTNLIKSEFLEDENINLIFDIDLSELDIVERYTKLRESHPFTKDSSKLIELDSIEEFINLLDEERQRFKSFKNYAEDNDIFDPLWYPKAAWLINPNNNLLIELTKIVTNQESKLYSTVLEESEFPIDGFIIQPTNGGTEAKIKPDNQMTVDLEWNGNNWLTKEGKKISNVSSKNIKLSKNIWRCYWENNGWVPREIRWDKNRPNPNFIFEILQRYHLNKWYVEDIQKYKAEYYQQENSYITSDLLKYFKKQRNIQLQTFNVAECQKNKRWLDIGCGKGNSIRNINQFYPSNYVGFDNDPFCVWESKERHSKDHFNFTLYDLSDENKSSICDIDIVEQKFDYIVCNFVIHFSAHSKDVWYKWINKITEKANKGTKLFINFMDFEKLKLITQDNLYQIDTNSYVQILDDEKLNNDLDQKWAGVYFDWTHKMPTTEPLINKNRLINDWFSSGWELTNEYSIKLDELKTNKFNYIYTWLTFTKL